MTPTAAAIAQALYPERCEVHTLGTERIVAQGCPVHHVRHVENMVDTAIIILIAFMIAAATNATLAHRS